MAGYIGTPAGRDMHSPGSQGLARVPTPKPKRFSVSYHLLRLGTTPPASACRHGSTTARRSTA